MENANFITTTAPDFVGNTDMAFATEKGYTLGPMDQPMKDNTKTTIVTVTELCAFLRA
jgi:hypothetical protein